MYELCTGVLVLSTYTPVSAKITRVTALSDLLELLVDDTNQMVALS